MKQLVPAEIEAYAVRCTTPVPPLLDELRQATYDGMEQPQMQVGAVEGTLLHLLVRLSGARRGLEIGMFTGYSALMMAAALPDDGELITCEVDPAAEAMARSFFQRSPHGAKIHIRMGPALETLRTLQGSFDFVFLDADKQNYPAYYEAALPLLRPGGWIAADNTLWSGDVLLDPSRQEPSARALAAFGSRLATDERVVAALMTVRDGITLAWKKP